jgi:hypothetical protein
MKQFIPAAILPLQNKSAIKRNYDRLFVYDISRSEFSCTPKKYGEPLTTLSFH